MTEKPKTGRPLKSPAPGTRVSLGLKVTPKIKNAVDAAAARNGRTQSQEAEVRLERSFYNDGLLAEALANRFGRHLAGVLIAIGEAMAQAGATAGVLATGSVHSRVEWPYNAYSVSQARQAAVAVLDELVPNSDRVMPPQVLAGLAELIEGFPANMDQKIGTAAANGILSAIAGRPVTASLKALGDEIRELISAEAKRGRTEDS